MSVFGAAFCVGGTGCPSLVNPSKVLTKSFFDFSRDMWRNRGL